MNLCFLSCIEHVLAAMFDRLISWLSYRRVDGLSRSAAHTGLFGSALGVIYNAALNKQEWYMAKGLIYLEDDERGTIKTRCWAINVPQTTPNPELRNVNG